MRKWLLVLTSIAGLVLSTACTPAPEKAATATAPDYKTIATIKDIMDSQVDPSADYIWESIGTEVSAKGVIEKRPQNDEEWKEERRRAILLVEAANLLVMPGRHVAKAGEKSENPGIELGPEEIEALIAKDRPAFIKLAGEFQETAIEQLRAVEARDVNGLLKAGGDIDTKCENCHKKYWYPNDPSFQEPPASTVSQEKK